MILSVRTSKPLRLRTRCRSAVPPQTKIMPFSFQVSLFASRALARYRHIRSARVLVVLYSLSNGVVVVGAAGEKVVDCVVCRSGRFQQGHTVLSHALCGDRSTTHSASTSCKPKLSRRKKGQDGLSQSNGVFALPHVLHLWKLLAARSCREGLVFPTLASTASILFLCSFVRNWDVAKREGDEL